MLEASYFAILEEEARPAKTRREAHAAAFTARVTVADVQEEWRCVARAHGEAGGAPRLGLRLGSWGRGGRQASESGLSSLSLPIGLD